jgi:hypothetical protein
MNTTLKNLKLTIILTILISLNQIHGEKLKEREKIIDLIEEFKTDSNINMIKNKDKHKIFLFADKEIKSILTNLLNPLKYEEINKASFEIILEETFKYIKNLNMIFRFEGKINKGKEPDSIICKSCIITFNTLNFILKESYRKKSDEFFKISEKICSLVLGFTKDTCELYTKSYSPVIFDSLIDSHLTGKSICSNEFFCSNLHIKYLDPDEYARNLLADKPKNKTYEISKFKINSKFSNKKIKILHLTDMHTDLDYTEGSNANCKNAVCCQITDIPDKLKFLEEKFSYEKYLKKKKYIII